MAGAESGHTLTARRGLADTVTSTWRRGPDTASSLEEAARRRTAPLEVRAPAASTRRVGSWLAAV